MPRFGGGQMRKIPDMARYGTQFGPDITFLGVERCDWQDAATYADADVVILGAPFDGGTSHRPRHPVRPSVHPAVVLPAARRVEALAGDAGRRVARSERLRRG
ncbi:hypothetical protein GCM10020219_067510 [Nonomuraea dietziae]